MGITITICVTIAAIIIVAMTYIYGVIRGWTKVLAKDGKIDELRKFYKDVLKEVL